MKKMIIMGVAALMLVGVSVGASLFFTGAFNKEPNAGAAVPVEEELPEEILYYNVQPEFVVNFQGKTRMKFLMIEMAVATRDPEVPAILDDHDSEVLKTIEGKQALQKSAIERLDEIVAKYHKNERILDVLITRLVMQ